ncbi:MAG TPA: hypothetical protein VM785_01295, partial [Gaiellales bacterium]|nr:hypothetical protein [Gaiellales bacterium]
TAPPAAAQAPEPAAPGGPLQVERIESAFVFQPDVTITEVDGRTATLVGGRVGVLTDGTFFAGGGLNTLANPEDDLKLTYGGLVLGWQFVERGPVSLGVTGLIGYGEATLGDDVTAVRPTDPRRGFAGGPTTVRVLTTHGFFVAEPQATVQWRILRWLALDGSAGYRAVAGADWHDERIRGVAGRIGIRFGG